MDKRNDPVAELAKGLAADHVTARNRGDLDRPAETETETESSPDEGVGGELVEEDDDDGASFVGEFEDYDAVRAFIEASGGELIEGDLAVVNGGLVRFEGGAFRVVLSDIIAEHGLPVDHTEQFSRGLADIERAVLNAEFESGPLLGGLRDAIIGMFKARPKAWTELSQMEQRELAKQIEGQAKALIRKVVRVVSEGEEISVTGKLERYTHAGAFDLKISANSDEEAALQLFRMQGHEVIIRSADATRFLEAAPDAQTDPDQPELFSDPVKAEEVTQLRETIAPPEDDSDLADSGDDEFEDDDGPFEEPEAADGSTVTEDMASAASVLDELDGNPGAYESRSNPEDEVEVEVESDAAIVARVLAKEPEPETPKDLPAADYVGPKQPGDAVPGESWRDTNDDRVRYLHPSGKWYLSPPKPEALEAWRAENDSPPAAQDDDGFPDSPSS